MGSTAGADTGARPGVPDGPAARSMLRTSRRLTRLWVKISAGMAVLAVLTAVGGLVLALAARSAHRYVERVVEVDQPKAAAAYEMEINVVGYGLGVLRYLQAADPVGRARMADDRADFMRFHERYQSLASSAVERDFSARILAQFTAYDALGEQLVDRRDRREVHEAALVASEGELDRALDAAGLDALEDQTESLVSEVMATIGRIERDSTVEKSAALALVDELPVLVESVGAPEVEDAVASVVVGALALLDVQSGLTDGVTEFVELREGLDELLDDQIQVIADAGLAEASERAATNTDTVRKLFLVGALAIALAAVVVGWGVARMVRRPVRDLAVALEAVRSGQLDHRIASTRRDELGDLARDLDATTDLLQRTTVSVDELQRSQAELRSREADTARLTRVVEAATDVIALCNPSGTLLHLNEVGRRALSGGDAGCEARHYTVLVHPDHHGMFNDQAMTTTLGTGHWRGEFDLVSHDGTRSPSSVAMLAHRSPAGAVEYVSVIARDITELRGALALLARQAMFDPLTGLPNRQNVLDRLTAALARCRRSGRGLAVLYLDLDRFKEVNDNLGHAAGDVLLVDAARRLQAEVRTSDTVARLGGDEFAVICDDVPDLEDVTRVARRILSVFEKGFHLDGVTVFVSASIGIAAAGAHHDAETLIADADVAMYRAKDAGRGVARYFDEAMRSEVEYRHRTELELRRAITEDELRVFYQPVVRLADASLVGFEALVRWQHPDRGLLSPDHFLLIAEESALVDRIDDWVFDRACRQVATWNDEATSPVAISVNVSGRHLTSPGYVESVLGCLERHGVAPSSITLEVTETSLLGDPDRAQEVLASLRARGLSVSIDDFGTGYSSLSYLQRFAFDALKIDRSFVAEVTTTRRSTAIVAASVALARTLGYKVVAEGVENIPQISVLLDLGCDLAQGYFFSRPVSADKATAMVHGELPWTVVPIDVTTAH